MDPISNIALASGLSWASGIRLYATLFIIGILDKYQFIALPESFNILSHPAVIGVTGFLTVVEFLADKIPYVDSTWDSIQTFIRIPMGALLAMGVFNSGDPLIAALAALLGGTLTGMTHASKAGTRAVVNTSPEPVSNVATSFAEEGLFLTGGWLAIAHPFIFLGLLLVFVLFMLWLLPKVWRGAYRLIKSLGRLLSPQHEE